MKFRRLFKKAAVALMAAVTALSVLPATTAFAAGDIGTISFTHTYDSSGNTMRYNSSAVFDGYTAGRIPEKIPALKTRETSLQNQLVLAEL